MKLSTRLPATIVALAIMVGVGVCLSGYWIASGAAQAMALERLSTMAQDRTALLRQFIDARKLSVVTAARSETVQNAIRDLHFGWLKLGEDPAGQLLSAYVTKNPNPADQRAALLDAGTGSNYDSAHSRVQPALKALAESADYQDVYLFDAAGNCIYSTTKTDTFAASAAPGGTLENTAVGEAIRDASADPQQVIMTDITPYSEMEGAPALFLFAAVADKRGLALGTIGVRVSVAKITTLLNASEGLGETGEVVVVGADGLLRSNSRFTSEDDTLLTALPADTIAKGQDEQRAEAWRASYRGRDMLAEVVPMDDGKVHWQIATLAAAEEALRPASAMGSAMLWSAFGLIAIASATAFITTRKVIKPITQLTGSMRGLANSELHLEVPHHARKDEIGDMARAVLVFKKNAIEVAGHAERERTASEERRRDRSAMMAELQSSFGAVVASAAIGEFSQRVTATFADPELNVLAGGLNTLVDTIDRGLVETGAVLASLARADVTGRVRGDYRGAFHRLKTDTNAVAERLTEIVAQLRQTSGSLKLTMGEVMRSSEDLADRTIEQTTNIANAAATLSHLAETVSANASRTEEAKQVSDNYASAAETGGQLMASANQAMERIADSSQKVSSIVGMIDDIAFQTNLLALNASVEAARAGEAGRGFAVVAVEVRRLAQSAAAASSQVKSLVEESSREVATGTRLVVSAAETLSSMREAAQRANHLIDGIAIQNRNEASVLDDVSKSVRTLDQLTRHNAVLVEGAASAIKQTERQAADLDDLLGVFVAEDIEVASVVRSKAA